MTDHNQQRFDTARHLGPLALLRLRAEVLLERDHHSVTAKQREELLRIASTPREDDREFLGGFDYIFEADEAAEQVRQHLDGLSAALTSLYEDADA